MRRRYTKEFMATINNDETAKSEDSVRKKSFLRRSVTEPKFSNGNDRTPSPLFTRRFTVPHSRRNSEHESQKSAHESSKTDRGNSRGRRSWIRSRLFKQPSMVGVLQGWEEYEDPGSCNTSSVLHKDLEKRCSRVSSRNTSSSSSSDHSEQITDSIFKTSKRKTERVSEPMVCNSRGINQRKWVNIEESEPNDRLSRMSIASAQSYTSLNVHTVLEYTTQHMDSLFAAKHYDATELAMLRRNSMDSVSPSSKEYSMVIEQLNKGNEINNNNNNNQETKSIVKKKSRKRWNSLKTKFRAKNAFVCSVNDMQSKLNFGNLTTRDESLKRNTATPNVKSRGWLIVKQHLSQIAEMAPPEENNPKPMLNIRHLAQLVKAKEFRLLMKRRASFVENGKFRYEEAKADLYSRYPIPTVVNEQVPDDGTSTPQQIFKRRNLINNSIKFT